LNKKAFLIMLVCLALTSACDTLADPPPTVTPIPVISTPTVPVCSVLTVAYIRENTVWLWRQGAIAAPLSAAGGATRVKISQDCKWVAFIQGGQLYIAPTDRSSGPTVLVDKRYLFSLTTPSSGDAQIVEFDFAPNSQTIYFMASISGDNGGMDLFKIDFATWLPVRFIGPGMGGSYKISPDSNCLTLSRPNQLDLYCFDVHQLRNIFTFPNECGFGVHTGPDVQWKPDSSGFFVVVPDCDDNSLHGWQRLMFVPRVGGDPQQMVPFIGWIYEKAYIAPDGSCVAHIVDTGDLDDLHLACTSDQSDSIYVSFPREDIAFDSWVPDSRHFVFSMDDNDTMGGGVIKPLYGEFNFQPVPLLSEQRTNNFPNHAPPTEIRWVNKDTFIFISNGLWAEQFNGNMIPIDTQASYIQDYDYSPKP
jgi:hypothetical protein